MSMYHSAELCYLAAVYNNLLAGGKAMDFWFKPDPALVEDRVLRVAPDLLPAGSVRITAVEIDGAQHTDFNAHALTVRLPETSGRIKVKVRLEGNSRTEVTG